MLVLLSLVACSGPYGAPYGSTVQINPESVVAQFGLAFYDEDGFGAVSYVEAAVFGDNNVGVTAPLQSVAVVITSDWPGAYIVPSEAINQIDDLATACDEDASAEGCGVFEDNTSGNYYEVTGEYAYVDTLRPNTLYGETDARGVVPFYVFFDSLPYATSDTSFAINASISYNSATMSVVVQAEETD